MADLFYNMPQPMAHDTPTTTNDPNAGGFGLWRMYVAERKQKLGLAEQQLKAMKMLSDATDQQNQLDRIKTAQTILDLIQQTNAKARLQDLMQSDTSMSLMDMMGNPQASYDLLRSGQAKFSDILKNQAIQKLLRQMSSDKTATTTTTGTTGTTGAGAGAGIGPGTGPIDARTLLTSMLGLTGAKANPLLDPLSATEQLNYAPQNGKYPKNLLEAQNYKLQTPETRKSMESLKGANTILQRMTDLTNKIFQSKSFFSRITDKGLNAWRAKVQSNPNLILYNSLRQGTKSLIVRALGEKGTLTDQDIIRIDQMFPNTGLEDLSTLPDSREVASLKLQQLKSILNGIVSGQYNTLTDAINGTGGSVETPKVDTSQFKIKEIK